jgi:hypothetical protein
MQRRMMLQRLRRKVLFSPSRMWIRTGRIRFKR